MAMFCSKLRREWGIPMPCVHRLQVDRMSFTYHQTRVTVKPASHVLVMLCNLKEQHVQLDAQPQHVQVPDVMSRTRLARPVDDSVGPTGYILAFGVSYEAVSYSSHGLHELPACPLSARAVHDAFVSTVASRARFPLHWMKLPRKGAWSMMCIMWQQLLHSNITWLRS